MRTHVIASSLPGLRIYKAESWREDTCTENSGGLSFFVFYQMLAVPCIWRNYLGYSKELWENPAEQSCTHIRLCMVCVPASESRKATDKAYRCFRRLSLSLVFHLDSGGSDELLCIICIPRTPVPQTHGGGKVFPRSRLEEWKSCLLVTEVTRC